LISKRLIWIVIIIFIIGNLFFIPNLGSFVYLGNSPFSDIPISHYSNLLYIQNSIVKHHQIPLWSNLILSGYPFAENPLSGLWYLPGWVALLFPLPLGINISLLLHLLLGLIGMVFFLRSLKISEIGSLFGGMAFFFSAKIYAHIGAGHLSMLYAIAWTPWLLLYSAKVLQDGQKIKSVILTGIIWGFIFSADLRWSIPAFLIWIFVVINKNIDWMDFIKYYLASIILGLSLSIVSWLPLFQYLQLSTRNMMQPNEQMIYSLSFADLLNLLFPFFEGSAETKLYLGGVVILLALLGVFVYKQNKKIRKWYYLALIAIILSFGSNIPGMSLLYEIPGFSLLRVPSRFVFIFVFSLSVCAAYVVDVILNEKMDYKFSRIFFLVPIVFFNFLFFLGSVFLTEKFNLSIFWSVIVFSFSLVAIIFILKGRFNNQYLGVVLVLILFCDLIFVNFKTLTFKPFHYVVDEKIELIKKIESISANFRVYTPSYSITQEQGAYWNINQINGVDPLQLKAYVELFNQISGIPNNQYSVTLPPFRTSNPNIDNEEFCPNLKGLEELNVKYVISNFDLTKCSLGKEIKLSSTYIYDISGVDNYVKNKACENGTKYSILSFSPNKIKLNVNSCEGLMQINEINYPGWRISINGKPALLQRDKLFRTFLFPGGEHEITLYYQPTIIYESLIIQTIVWLALICTVVIRRSRK